MAKTLYELYLDNMEKAGTQKASQPAALPAIKMPTLEAPKTTPTAGSATGVKMPAVGAKKHSGVDIVRAVTQKPAAQGGGRVTMPQVKKQETATDRLANIRAFGAGDYSGGGELLKKIGQTVASGVLGSAAGITEIAGQATPTTGEQHLGQFSGFGDIGRAVRESRETGEDINTITQRLEQERSQRRKADRQKTYAAADKLTERSAQLQQKAKEGTGKVGGFLVDLGVTGTQMAGDALANVLLPGSGLAAMGTRVYGQSAGDARREGKTEEQQVLSGLKGATIEVLTEKLFGGLAKAYGAGTADELVEKMAGKLTRTAAGKRVATWLINSGGEGIEEVVSDLLNPLADRALGLDDGKSPIYTTDDVAQMGYDFLLGTAMGAIGGAGQLWGTKSAPAVQEAQPVQMPTLVDANGRTAAQRQAWAQLSEPQRAQLDEADKIARRFGARVELDSREGVSGSYRDGVITLNPNTANPVRQTLIHELTHHMESSGQYSRFSDTAMRYVAENMGADVESVRQAVMADYARSGVTLDEDGATREIVAKFAEEKLFTDEATVRRLLAEDRNLFQRIYDWIRDALNKLTGTGEEAYLRNAEKLYAKALREAGAQESDRGTQMLFAGKNAKTADMRTLERATALEANGISPESILKETGWFRGMDGKWRFEIDDSAMQYDRQGVTQNPDVQRKRQLEEKLLYGQLAQEEANELRTLTEMTRDIPSPRTLSDYIQHDALFEAYPELRDAAVVFEETEPGVNGYYNAGQNTIVLDSKLRGAPESTLVHEIQHAVQRAEGFAGGATPSYWEYKNKDGQAYRTDRQYMEAEKRGRDAFDAMPDTVQDEVRRINRAKLDQDWDEVLRLEDDIYNGPYAELYSAYDLANFDRRSRVDYYKGANYVDIYTNTAGEIEARDAANRRSYSAEQRRLRMPQLGDANTVFADGNTAAYDINPNHRNAVDQWNREGRPEGETFILGSTGSVLQGLGAIESDIYMQGDKINRILQDHPEMTLEEIKRLPEILEDPVLVLKSKGSGGIGKTSRVVMFGTVRAQNGQPVMAVLDLRPYENGFLVTDMQKVNSSYTKKNPADFIRSSEVLYADEKRAAPLLRLTGLTIASQQLLQNGSVGSISYAGQDVNIEGTPFSDMTRREQLSTGRGLDEIQRDAEAIGRATAMMDRDFAEMEQQAREQRRQQEEAGRQIPETLRRLGVEPYGSEADYAGAETLAREAKNSSSARRSIQKQIGKMEASEKERLFARQLAEGKLTLRDIPGTLDAERLLTLADLYRAMDSDPAAALLSRRRETILERETAKMEPLLGMDVTYDEGGMTDTGKRSGSVAKRFGTLRRNLQTPARVCETEWGAAHGREVYDTLFRPVTENNGRQITWVNSMLDRVRTFKDSSGNVRELNRAERALVQRLVEHQAAEGRVMKLDRQYAPAAENVRNGQAAEDAAREFGIDRSTQEYEDLLNYQAYISAMEDLKTSKEADATAVQAAVQAYSGIYKELYEGINTFLVAHGYQPIGFIEGYAPHLQPEAEKTAFTKALKLLGLDDVAMELPTSISGKTAELKPYKQYNPFFQQRRGDKTEYDIAKGYEDYVYYLGNIFYHTDDIMRIRAAERYIRKTYSSEEAGEMISQAEGARNFSDAGIEEFLRMSGVVGKDTQLGEGDARNLLGDYIDKLYDQVGNVTRYSEMAKYLDNYANRLAGKQSYVDRGTEAATGRGSLNWINALSGKYGGAKLAFNVSSAINQTSQLPMVAVENGEINTARAMRDFFGKDRVNFVKESNFLNGKRGVKWLLGAETGWDKFKQYGFTMTEAVDSFTAYTAVRSKYLKELKAGKSHAEALALADEYGRRVMGSRTRGEKPVLFDTKNPFWQIVTRFQLETLNSWEHVRRDLPNEYRTMASEKGKAYAAGVMGGRAARYVLYAFLANLGVGMLSGGSPVPYDVVGNTVEALGKAWGLTKSTAVATILDNVLQAVFDERLFGTPEPDDEDNADWWAALESLFGNVANDVPVVSRAAALAGIGDQTLAAADLSKAWDVVKDVKSNGFSTDTLDKALTAGGEFLYGGNQLRKTVQGTMDVARGGRYSKGKLRYQVEQTPWNYIKGALFGRSSLDEAQDYYAEKSSDFSARQTEAFGTMQDAGVTAKESYDLIQKLRGIEKTDDESRAELQRRALMASTVSGEGKAAAYYGLLASDTEKDAMDAVDAADPDTDMGEVTRLLVQFKSCKNDTQKLEALESSTLTLRQKAEMYNNLIASEETLRKQSELKAFDGITAENYYLYKAATLGLTVKAAKLLAIDSLNLTAAQKDALYYSEGWAESKLHEAPWHGGQIAAVRMPVVKTTGGAPVFVRVAQSAPTVQMPVVRTTAKAPVYVRVTQNAPKAVRVVKMPVVK